MLSFLKRDLFVVSTEMPDSDTEMVGAGVVAGASMNLNNGLTDRQWDRQGTTQGAQIMPRPKLVP